MALNLARIIGTITGKLAFERTDANFQLIQTDVNANTLAIADKLPTSHNTDEAAHDDIRQQINDLDAEVDLKVNKIQEAWINATLENGWTNQGGSFATVGYCKNELGILQLRGLIKPGTTAAGTVLFTLPVGYRPAIVNKIQTIIYVNFSSFATLIIDINPDGKVAIGNVAVAANATWISLDGISIRL